MGAVTLLAGTTKGAFILRDTGGRGGWQISGPFCNGWPVNHMTGDPGTGRLWAGGGNDFFGAAVWRSDDDGATWEMTKLANGGMDRWLAEDPSMAEYIGHGPSPEAPFEGLDAVWSLGWDGARLWAGCKPAELFVSEDGGASFARVEGLSQHPSRDSWTPGGAGLTLHTIVTGPAQGQIWLGISAAGVFASEDGGASWERRNRLSNAAACDHGHSHGDPNEIGHCVHNMVRAPGDGALLYQQNHHGVFRSADAGRSWQDITAGLPSGFGFPVAVHPRDPETLWVMPMNGDIKGRYPPDASAAVWKSTDGGSSWARKDTGLPTQNCYFTVLRQAMSTDRQEPAGLYFGTNSGSVFASRDAGESFDEIARHLPTVLSIDVHEAA